MADKVGESLLTALEKRPVNISVEAKEKTSPSGKNTSTSHFSPREHVLLAGTDSGAADKAKTDEERAAAQYRRGTEAARQFADLGLGRGVDSTRTKPWQERTPWLEKTSFQVRSLEFDNLLGTAKGGAVEAYEYEVWSERKLQGLLQHSVSSTPVTIGVDADYSRTSTNSRHVVGRRVHNRTISFREEFDEIPSTSDADKGKGVPLTSSPAQPPSSPADDDKGEGGPLEGGHTQPGTSSTAPPKEKKKGLTYEEKLAKWVLERVDRDDSKAAEDGNSQSPVVVFEKWFKDSHERDARKVQISQLCHEFVEAFPVTHYVSALELGALEYSVMTEEDYLRQVGAAGSLGLEKVVSATLKSKSSYSLHKTRKNSQMKRVGLIKNPEGGEYYVPRGKYAEAVIGVQMKPIHTLIRNEYLRQPLSEAVKSYIEKKEDRSEGPFLITSDSINRETVYLSVNERNMSLQATVMKDKASKFFVLMNDEGSNVHEFHIVYLGKEPQTLASFGPSQRGTTPLQPPHHYLSAPLSLVGSNSGPLYFELNPKQHHSMFVLHSRLRTRGAPAEVLGPWVQGHESYFIHCHARKFAHDGYLAVQRAMKGGVVQYSPMCVPSRRSSDDYFKVFSLVRPPMEGEQPPTVRELNSSPYTRRALGPSDDNQMDADGAVQMHPM